MIALLLACTHTPAALYPTPFTRLPIDDPANTGPEPDVRADGRLVVTVEDFARLKTRSQLLDTRTAALNACYDHREEDRVRAQEAYATRDLELHRALRREDGLRVAVPVVGVMGVGLGLGLGVAYSWANSRALGVGFGGAL